MQAKLGGMKGAPAACALLALGGIAPDAAHGTDVPTEQGSLRALERPFWTQQQAAIAALVRMEAASPEVTAALERTAKGHWSAILRKDAADALAIIKRTKPRSARVPRRTVEIGFHRRATNHGLPICHGKQPGNGKYRLPWLGSFPVRWQVKDPYGAVAVTKEKKIVPLSCD